MHAQEGPVGVSQPPRVGDCGCVTNDEEEAVRAIEHALAEIKAATARLQTAEHDLEKAEEDLKVAREQKHRFAVSIIYNGVEKPLTVEVTEPIKKVLERAIQLFGSLPNPHTLALYADGRELADNKTVGEECLRPKEKILLRPSAVKGG